MAVSTTSCATQAPLSREWRETSSSRRPPDPTPDGTHMQTRAQRRPFSILTANCTGAVHVLCLSIYAFSLLLACSPFWSFLLQSLYIFLLCTCSACLFELQQLLKECIRSMLRNATVYTIPIYVEVFTARHRTGSLAGTCQLDPPAV